MTNWTRYALVTGLAMGFGAVATAQETTENSLDAGRAYAAELLADADGRTSMLAQQNQAFSVRVGGQIMFRYVFNNASDLGEGVDDNTVGFQARRTKVSFSGNIIDQSWRYQMNGAFSRSSGAFGLENAFVQRRFDEGYYVQFGQFKLPFLREEGVSSTRQLAADRSAMNGYFTQGYSQGIELGFGGRGDDAFRIAGAFSDGLRSSNTEIGASPADFALTARAEYKVAGDWGQFRQFTSFPNSDFATLIGGAIHYQSGGDTFGTPDVEIVAATVDASILGNGWNVYAAGVWAMNDPEVGTDFDDMGFLIQGGLFVAPNTELFGRWDAIFADSNRTVGDFHVLTVGMNHYFSPESHAAKLTLDVQYLFDAPTESLTPSGGGLRGIGLNPNDMDDGQFAIRAQMQILF